jgi:hypothetical protein
MVTKTHGFYGELSMAYRADVGLCTVPAQIYSYYLHPHNLLLYEILSNTFRILLHIGTALVTKFEPISHVVLVLEPQNM